MIFTLESALKAALLAGAALALAALLRHQSAAVRHWILTVGVACVAALPLLALVVPPWHIPRRRAGAARRCSAAPVVAITIMPRDAAATETAAAVASRPSPRLSRLPALVWAVGVARQRADTRRSAWSVCARLLERDARRRPALARCARRARARRRRPTAGRVLESERSGAARDVGIDAAEDRPAAGRARLGRGAAAHRAYPRARAHPPRRLGRADLRRNLAWR